MSPEQRVEWWRALGVSAGGRPKKVAPMPAHEVREDLDRLIRREIRGWGDD
jgi:hypothetical protein